MRIGKHVNHFFYQIIPPIDTRFRIRLNKSCNGFIKVALAKQSYFRFKLFGLQKQTRDARKRKEINKNSNSRDNLKPSSFQDAQVNLPVDSLGFDVRLQ